MTMTPNANNSKKLKPVTVWLPGDLARELDAKIAAACVGIPGARPSRQVYIIDLVRRSLAETTSQERQAAEGGSR